MFLLRLINGVNDSMIFAQGCTSTFIRTPTIIKNQEAGTPLSTFISTPTIQFLRVYILVTVGIFVL